MTGWWHQHRKAIPVIQNAGSRFGAGGVPDSIGNHQPENRKARRAFRSYNEHEVTD